MALSSLQIEAFLAVAKTLSFTKAGELLHITQSALSQRVMNLERELETSLFIRDRSGLRLTEAGQALVRYGRCKGSLEQEFISDLSGRELSGLIRIGGFSSVMNSVILPSLGDLLIENSKVKLSMMVAEFGQLPAALQRGEIDYMILDLRQSREDLVRVELGKEKNILVQKKRYRGGEVFLDHNEEDQVTFNYLKLLGGRRSRNIERQYLDNVYGLIEGVRLGLGRAVLPLHLIEGERDFEVIDPSVVLEIPVYLYFYEQPYYSKLHDKVVEAVSQSLALR